MGLLVFSMSMSVGLSVSGREDYCWVCNKPINFTLYTMKDEVAGLKRFVCGLCVELPNSCYLCSLPVSANYTELKDGRCLCERDVQSVLLDEAKITAKCEAAGLALDKLFSRYLSFPTNLTFHVVDRVTLLDLFKVPGKDYTCPNVLGYTAKETNEQNNVEFSISILSGQTPAATASTYAHELTHAWMMASLPPARLKELHRDSVEGFCELVAFMLMREENETAQIAEVRTNFYTRGQIHLFIDAEQQFGFGDVLDWVRSGATNRLRVGESWCIRDLKVVKETNNAPPPLMAYMPSAAVEWPDRLVLKSVSLGGKSPIALINQCTLGVGETGKVKLANTNLVIRCKAIRANSVLVEVVGTGKTQELRFEAQPKPRALTNSPAASR